MKNWALLVAGLYGVTVLALFAPLLMIGFGVSITQSDLTQALTNWATWGLLLLMVISQFALLRIPVCVLSRRPVTRRPLLATVISAALMMGLLGYGAAFCLYEFSTTPEGSYGPWFATAIGLLSWLFWSLYFYRSTRAVAAEAMVKRLQRFLWTGSILELLVAIPTHIVVRHRDYCCAGAMTFIGLTCGISVMLFAFDPSVFFLFINRWKKLQPP